MYAYIKGSITTIDPTHVVIENNGIGYLVLVPNPFYYNLNDNVTIYLHHYIRQDIFNLYGFNSSKTKDLFLKLISVSGIGPKTALGILSDNDNYSIINAINNNDFLYLMNYPGIGKKTAQQIVLDLSGKIPNLEDENSNSSINDAKLALSSLGYSNTIIDKALLNIDLKLDTQDIIKNALRNILK